VSVFYMCPLILTPIKAMVMMNRQMNLPAMQRILQNFEIESEKMDMKQEMMADVMGDIFEEEGEEEATDEIINQVLDEIGINLSSEVSNGVHAFGVLTQPNHLPAAR